MRKVFFVAIICLLLFSTHSYSQYNPRIENINYVQTKLFDDFNSLDRTKWKVHNGEYFIPPSKRNLLIWLDSISTVRVDQSNSNLALSLLKYPNYWMKNYLQDTIKANFIAGQVTSLDSYSYGIFECSATFSDQLGAFPAFWTHSDIPCSNSINQEIDIVEKKIEHTNPTLDNHIFYYPSNCSDIWYGFEFSPHQFNWGGAHTFKCVWTPTKLEFFVDNISIKVVENGEGRYWYPTLNAHVKLSQQAIEVNNDKPYFGIVTPQTSYFHWVKVREFFLAPEITCPSIICSTGTATMDVAPSATNISWALTPSNLFSGATTGSGTTANITAASCCQGKGKITYTFHMPSGETFSSEKDIWIKGPDVNEVSFDVFRSDGVRATKVGSTFLLCPNTNYQIFLLNSSPVPLSNYNWTVPSAWTRNYTYNNMISVYTNSLPGGQVIVTATNTASGCNNTIQPVTGYMGTNYSCGSYFMSFTPNPATSETTLELSADGEKVVNDKTEWELEVYDQGQSLKEKKTKLKGVQTKLNTSDWKDGVYLVRAKIGDEVVTEKLVVKH